MTSTDSTVNTAADDTPVLAIVGHPNKGKSSVVSTLAQDSSVKISPLSGTTITNRSYPMSVDGRELYRLVDTPGFQRARAVMDWMQRQSRSAADHAEVVRQFVAKHRDDNRFQAECELLSPIISGAGILYVIDGSVPYGPEYDAEMEVLRWTGQPSMALINPIGSADYIEQWKQPLSQYFRIVRVFNARSAPFARQVQLLTGFAELSDQWRKPLGEAAELLVTRRRQQTEQASLRIAELVLTMCNLRERTALSDPDDKAEIERISARFRQRLRDMEMAARSDVEQIFSFDDLQRDETRLEVLQADLFSESTWNLFGLSRNQLVALGVIGGGTAGGLLDLGSGGLTMMLGTGVGAVIGGVSALFGSRKLVETRIPGLAMGDNEMIVGPLRNINFPWIVMGRAVTHLRSICARTHAMREQLSVAHHGSANIDAVANNEPALPAPGSIADELDLQQRKKMQSLFSSAARRQPGSAQYQQLAAIIAPLADKAGNGENGNVD